MVVTMLEARVASDREADLENAYAADVSGELPPSIVESFLLHESGTDLWRIATVWRSREDLDEYRASVEVPSGRLDFRAAGAEPSLMIFDVARHVAH
ncbi:MAG: antibiotic biosynthesis monooxygenase [Candidatus Limnocylindria bacterium]